MENLKQILLDTGFVDDSDALRDYCQLIEENRNREVEKFITQKHHILPRAYFDLIEQPVNNKKENLVNLKYQDHILAHYYLALACKHTALRYKMISAINPILASCDKYCPELTEVERLQILVSTLPHYQQLYEEACKARGKHSSKVLQGRARPEEVRQKISQSSRGKVHTPEARKKMSEAHTGKVLSNETRQKISQANLGMVQPWAGRKQSPEEIENRRQKLLGHETSEETKHKISEANKGKTLSEETRAKLSTALKGREAWNKGKPSNIAGRKGIYYPDTLEIKYVLPEQLEDYLKQGWLTGNPSARGRTTGTRSRSIRCLETDEVFLMIKSAAAAKQIGETSIMQCLKGRSKTAGGYHWEYID